MLQLAFAVGGRDLSWDEINEYYSKFADIAWVTRLIGNTTTTSS